MAFDTYTEISVAADEVEDRIVENRTRLTSAKQEISTVVTAMTAISTQYGPIVAAIDVLVAASPTNTALLFLQSHIGKLLSDFNALQTEASTLDVLVNPPPPP